MSGSGCTVTTGEAAMILRLSASSVGAAARSGRLRHFRKNGRLLFDPRDIEQFAQARARRPANQRGRPTLVEAIERQINATSRPS